MGQFGDGEEGGGDPCPNFLHIGVQKVLQVVQIGGRGGQGNLDKVQKNSYFFRESVPKSMRGILLLRFPSLIQIAFLKLPFPETA